MSLTCMSPQEQITACFFFLKHNLTFIVFWLFFLQSTQLGLCTSDPSVCGHMEQTHS